MNKYYPNLWSPVRIGNLTVKNRIEAAPVGMSDLTPEGYLTPLNIAAYEVKARGGAGIVTLGESSVHTKTGKAHGTDRRSSFRIWRCRGDGEAGRLRYGYGPYGPRLAGSSVYVAAQ